MIRFALDFTAIGILVIWFLSSVLVLIPQLKPTIRRWDRLSMVPVWTFFAPRPLTGDYHLLFQDRFPDGTSTDWTEIRMRSARRWWNFIWNPQKRNSKALFDSVTEMAELVRRADRAIVGSIPYLTLLYFVSSLPRSIKPQSTQFLLMQSFGSQSEERPRVLLRSALHSI